jgi:hypothetical protein
MVLFILYTTTILLGWCNGETTPNSETESHNVVIHWLSKGNDPAPEDAFLLIMYAGGVITDIRGTNVDVDGLQSLVTSGANIKLVVEDTTPFIALEQVVGNINSARVGRKTATVFIYQGVKLHR